MLFRTWEMKLFSSLNKKVTVFASITTIFVSATGGAVWLTSTRTQIVEAKEQISSVKSRLKEEIKYTRDMRDQITKIGERLSRIEGKLDVIVKEVKK